MTCLLLACPGEEIDAVLAEAAFADLAGVEEEDGRVRLWLADPAEAQALRERLARWQPVVEEVEHRNWNEAWQRTWQPMAVGRRFWLAPPWDASETPEDRIRLDLHPGSAFGNGDHPATHLCLVAMEQDLRPGDVFLDVGCGSGLLGEAALALGAAQAWGCDLAPGGHFRGSVDALRTASCDYVVANIQLGVLLRLLPDIARVMRPGARGVLSGILPEQTAELKRAARQAGLHCGDAIAIEGWAAISLSCA